MHVIFYARGVVSDSPNTSSEWLVRYRLQVVDLDRDLEDEHRSRIWVARNGMFRHAASSLKVGWTFSIVMGTDVSSTVGARRSGGRIGYIIDL